MGKNNSVKGRGGGSDTRWVSSELEAEGQAKKKKKSKDFLRICLSFIFFQKLKLSKGDTSLDHCPTKLSLGEDPFLCKIQGN